MQKLLTGQEIGEMDRWAIQDRGIPGLTLMENAAQKIAAEVLSRKARTAAVVCGTGNNGGDGFAIARLLHEAGIRVWICGAGHRDRLNGEGDAAVNYRRALSEKIPVYWGMPFPEEKADCIVDALFGTGLNRDLTGEAALAVEWINRQAEEGSWVISVDIPSGIHSGTGQVMGVSVQAKETVTFSRLKPGLLLYPGRSNAGKIIVADIGIPTPNPIEKAGQAFTMEAEDAARLLPPRKADSHKGTYGKILVVAGSPGMMGAAIFAVRAAYHSGAGLVRALIPSAESLAMTLGAPEAVQIFYQDPVEAAVPEDVTCVLAGPGLGHNPQLLMRILSTAPAESPLILDADALNFLAQDQEARITVQKRAGNTVLTPHMGEASRLCGKSIADLYKDLPGAARELAMQYQSVVVLKNASTVIASPDGRIAVNRTGNAGMSTAGAGDVLAGTIAGLCGQGGVLWENAVLGVWLHGRAGDAAAAKKGMYAMTASDLAEFLQPDRLILS